ncbi:MAG: single-stranded DNA-binding protein [bacterium]
MASRSLNKVFLIGNLTRDPEIRYTSSGAAMCSFGIATNRTWKDSEGEVKEEAEFHNLVSWNKMAEICYQILAKGMMVYIEGELRTRNWEDESGETRYRTEIKVNEMILLDSRGKSGVGGGKTAEAGEGVNLDEMMKADSKDKAPEKEESAKGGSVSGRKAAKKVVKKEEEESDPLEDDLPF